MPVTDAALLMGEEAMWNNQVHMIFSSRHSDVEQPTLFLNFRNAPSRQRAFS
jgi:hypothetical protein